MGSALIYDCQTSCNGLIRMLKTTAVTQSNVKNGIFHLSLFMDMDSESFVQREMTVGDWKARKLNDVERNYPQITICSYG